jgi:hypothetical protein
MRRAAPGQSHHLYYSNDNLLAINVLVRSRSAPEGV